jgi:hypothetical protein
MMNRFTVAMAMLALAGCGADSPPPGTTGEPLPATTQDEAAPPAPAPTPTPAPPPLDASAVQALLNELAREYNAGRWVNAAALYSREVERRCGGATGLANALSRAHGIERVRYSFRNVVLWKDEPNKADVTVLENGVVFDTYGFSFTYEDGRWRFNAQHLHTLLFLCG